MKNPPRVNGRLDPLHSDTQTDTFPISATQVGQIRLKFRESELPEFPKPLWATVTWMKDSTKIAVHVRTDGLEGPELFDRFCKRARELIRTSAWSNL